MRNLILLCVLFFAHTAFAQQPKIDLTQHKKNGSEVSVNQKIITVTWPAGNNAKLPPGFSPIIVRYFTSRFLLVSDVLGLALKNKTIHCYEGCKGCQKFLYCRFPF